MNKMLAYCLLAITALAGVLAGRVAGPVGLEPAFTLRVFSYGFSLLG